MFSYLCGLGGGRVTYTASAGGGGYGEHGPGTEVPAMANFI